MKEANKEFDAKMQKTVDVVVSDFAGVRAGRANASVLDKITVDYYGTATPIQQVAAISSPDPRSLMIQPWDSSLGKVAIRNIRRDAMEKFKAMQKKSEMTEDDLKLYEKELQDMTEKRCKQIDDLTAKKEAELMAV